MERLPSSVWLHSLQYCTASELLRLLRSNRYQRHTLLADKTAELLLRRYFNLTKQQMAPRDTAVSSTFQRLLTPLASLERQLCGRSPPALLRTLFIHAICASDLTAEELAQPHSLPIPNESTQWVQHSAMWNSWGDCGTPHSTDLTLASIGLPTMQLWYQQPFWQRGWTHYLHHWSNTTAKPAECPSTAPFSRSQQLQINERDLICQKLDSRIRWFGAVESDPTTTLAIGFYYGKITRRRHWVPATFGRGGYPMELAYSQSSENECQWSMVHGGGSVEEGLPVVTFDLSGTMETINGHHLRVYGSLSLFLLSRATEHGSTQQLQQFYQQYEAQCCDTSSGSHEVKMTADTQSSGALSVLLKGLPFHLSCFPMSPHILSMWNTSTSSA